MEVHCHGRQEGVDRISPNALQPIARRSYTGMATHAGNAGCKKFLGDLVTKRFFSVFVLMEEETKMEVKISHLDKVRFAIHARSHSIICDQPEENGGDDFGMTPPELLLASLGSCAAFYAAQYLKTRNLAETGVEVSVEAEKLKSPARLGNFQIRVHSPVSLTTEQREGLMRSVEHCLVKNTLLNPPQILVEFKVPDPVGSGI